MKESLILLGTGNAMVTKCFNTCFVIHSEDHYFLVDAGGGNGIMTQLEKANVPYTKTHHMFVTHGHTDHVLGVIWMIRKIATLMRNGKYEGNFTILCHDELKPIIITLCELTIQKKFTDLIGNRIFITVVEDKEQMRISNMNFTFFDIHSTKAKQYGLRVILPTGIVLTCLGDEPYKEHSYEYVVDSDWLLSEAFCLYSDKEEFNPYEKHHSTVKEACELAELFKIPNLVLYHTEDKKLKKRKELYTKEGKEYYHGHLFVPNDLDEIKLN